MKAIGWITAVLLFMAVIKSPDATGSALGGFLTFAITVITGAFKVTIWTIELLWNNPTLIVLALVLFVCIYMWRMIGIDRMKNVGLAAFVAMVVFTGIAIFNKLNSWWWVPTWGAAILGITFILMGVSFFSKSGSHTG
jgi:hypothetical protein